MKYFMVLDRDSPPNAIFDADILAPLVTDLMALFADRLSYARMYASSKAE